jgi:predicted dehydrogenase
MADVVRWGILGTGRIARKFVQGVRQTDGGQVVAVGSRSDQRAETFGSEFSLPARHGSYESLAADETVDAIYVATLNPAHAAPALLAIHAGKHVLVEKPFTVSAAEAKEVIDAARAGGVFCMEAMWSRFAPPFTKLRELIADGHLGEIRQVHAHFGFRCEWDPSSRLLNPHHAGGALLDVGVYPVSLASMLLGAPQSIHSTATIGETGVDEQTTMLLDYPDRAAALLSCAVRTETPKTVTVCGTEARVTIDNAWWGDKGLTLHAESDVEHFDLPREGNGYNYEAAHVAACLAEGLTESPIMPLNETLSVMRTLDEVRRQIGLRYPFE